MKDSTHNSRDTRATNVGQSHRGINAARDGIPSVTDAFFTVQVHYFKIRQPITRHGKDKDGKAEHFPPYVGQLVLFPGESKRGGSEQIRLASAISFLFLFFPSKIQADVDQTARSRY